MLDNLKKIPDVYPRMHPPLKLLTSAAHKAQITPKSKHFSCPNVKTYLFKNFHINASLTFWIGPNPASRQTNQQTNEAKK